jgi:hypothetical protein
MYRGNTPKTVQPNMKTRSGPSGSVAHKNTMGSGNGGPAKAAGHLMSHGERCAHASGHVLGKGGG